MLTLRSLLDTRLVPKHFSQHYLKFSVYSVLSALDKPLLPIIMKSTFSPFATLTIPSGVDPIPNVNRIFTPSVLAASILLFNIDSLPAFKYFKICVLALSSAAFSFMYFRIESDCNSLRSIMWSN